MSKKDYYETLGINKDASQEDIKKAFRQLARKYHPDIAGKESEEKFKEINEAFQVLGDPQKKAQYDQFGSAAFRPEDFSGFRTPGFDELFRSFGFGDIFEAFSGRERGRAGQEEGADLRHDLEISLEDSFSGVTEKIDVQGFSACKTCDGTGAKHGSVRECANCNGTGEVRRIQRVAFAQVMNIGTCGKCGGSGKIIEKPCEDCDGEGRVRKTRKIEVKIPKGVDSGSYLRIAGQGEAGHHGGEPGDLYVVIHVKEHPTFDRHEDDLFCQTVISLGQAVFGCEVEVPTINGKAKFKIPAGTQSHTVFRLKGQGMPELRGLKRGDQMVKIVVETPRNLSERQKAAMKEFVESGGGNVKTTKGFFERMREHI